MFVRLIKLSKNLQVLKSKKVIVLLVLQEFQPSRVERYQEDIAAVKTLFVERFVFNLLLKDCHL